MKDQKPQTLKRSAAFKTTVRATGGNTTGIEALIEAVAALGTQERTAVKVSFSGYNYQSRIGVVGDQ
ncbi:MAG TPA: hypothetical protein VJN71_10280 [Nitrososphaerales archaeon]|nr:hypothetical protein [Nitrososphaerales archaeon]